MIRRVILGIAESCKINADTLQREDLQRFEKEDKGFEIYVFDEIVL